MRYSITDSTFPASQATVYVPAWGPDDTMRKLAGARIEGVAVGVTVGVAVGVGVFVAVGVRVGVGVFVAVGIGDGNTLGGPRLEPNGTAGALVGVAVTVGDEDGPAAVATADEWPGPWAG